MQHDKIFPEKTQILPQIPKSHPNLTIPQNASKRHNLTAPTLSDNGAQCRGSESSHVKRLEKTQPYGKCCDRMSLTR